MGVSDGVFQMRSSPCVIARTTIILPPTYFTGIQR